MTTDTRTDLRTLERMLEDLEPYLLSNTTFWPLGGAGLPQLSLGQYLLVTRRLTNHKEAHETVAKAEATLENWRSAAARKAEHELPQRVRLWRDHLADLEVGTGRAPFASDVTQRVIVELLIERYPEIAHSVAGLELRTLDATLRAMWRPGPALWPEHADEFPASTFWYLYGAPEAVTHRPR